MALPGDELLFLYLAEALDPADHAAVERSLRQNAALWTRLQLLRAETETDVDLDRPSSPFRIPPPGLGLAVEAGQPRVMGPSRLRVGDRFQVRMEPRRDPGMEGVVVLRDLGKGWDVLIPTRPDQVVALARLPVEADGRHRIDLIASPPAGRQRWAVALLPLSGEREAEPGGPWAGLYRGLASGIVPVGVVEIDLV